MRFAATLLATALLAAPAVLHAQASAGGAAPAISKAEYLAETQRDFTEIDANKDKVVTAAEVEAARTRALATMASRRAEAMFEKLDADKNGSLSQAEFAKLLKPSGKLPPSPISAMDSNKDGRITAAEYKTGVESRFSRMDANKDGLVTPAELRPTAPSR